MHAKMYSRLYSIGSDSGRVSFWGDAYTVRKWTRNLRKKNRKCVPTKRIEKRMPECRISKEPFRFREIKCSQTMHASMCSRHVLFGTTESRFFFFLRTLYTSLPWFCVQLDFYAYHTQKFALTRPLLRCFLQSQWSMAPVTLELKKRAKQTKSIYIARTADTWKLNSFHVTAVRGICLFSSLL